MERLFQQSRDLSITISYIMPCARTDNEVFWWLCLACSINFDAKESRRKKRSPC